MFNYDEIRKTIKLFKPNGDLFEIRILGKKTYSGFLNSGKRKECILDCILNC